MAAKSFLRVVHKSIVFSDLVKALVYNGEEGWYRCSLLVENPT